MRSYSTSRNPVTFEVDGELYTTKPSLAAEVIFDLEEVMSAFADRSTRQRAFQDLKTQYRRILTAESYALFEPRISGDCDDGAPPIDAITLVNITKDIMTDMGKGQSQQPASSAAG